MLILGGLLLAPGCSNSNSKANSNPKPAAPSGFKFPDLTQFLPMVPMKPKEEPPKQSDLKLVVAEAKVQQFDPDMHYCVLQTDGRSIGAWWDVSTEIHRAKLNLSEWNGRSGDRVKVSGFEVNGELYLRQIWLK